MERQIAKRVVACRAIKAAKEKDKGAKKRRDEALPGYLRVQRVL